ncbi:MAG: mechanosensitive ion channel [Flavobacteriales bacterium]|nr:mechanosensitive ion channel [Flavobacteriales bacterium]
METIDLIQHRVTGAFNATLNALIDHSPNLLLAGLVVLLGWLLARLVRWVIIRMAVIGRLESLSARIGLESVLKRTGVDSLGRVLGAVAYWVIILGTMMLAAEVLGMQPVIDGLQRVFAYIPTLFAALAVFLFGFWLADKARFVMGTMGEAMGIGGGKVIGRILFIIILLFLTITALNVAGVDTTLITSNILIVVGSLFIAFSIAYGFAAKEILTNILSSYYGKDRFKPGMRVRIGQDEGVIVSIDSIRVALRAGDREILIPTSRLVSDRIEILAGDASGELGN